MWKVSRLLCHLIACSALVLMQQGCAHSPGSLQVNVTDECQKLPGKVELPDVNEDSDYRVIAAEALSAANMANKRIEAKDRCGQHVIDRYKAGG